MTYKDIKHNEEVNELLKKGNQNLGLLGYTDHSQAHCVRVAETAAQILKKFGYSEHDIELARIAGYMHDIGNCVNRTDHAHSGAIMAFTLLTRMNMPPEEIAIICSAIGHHDEKTAFPVNAVSAALILSDKSDVRRSRVRKNAIIATDIHDRVNYSVKKHEVTLTEKEICLTLAIDTEVCAVIEYFEIFMDRMLLCRRAAEKLGLHFALVINGQRMA